MMLSVPRVRHYLKNFELEKLFTEELGWDRRTARLEIQVDGKTYALRAFAEKRGVQIFLCQADGNGKIPSYNLRQKIEKQVTKSAYEHLIVFVDDTKTTQVWQWVARQPGQPAAYREHSYHPQHQSGEALIQKLNAITIPLNEEEALDLTGTIQKLKDAFNRDQVTKRFYDQFKREHAAFLKFIVGITEQGDKDWYASLMLNRLMFVYFIQKKGFLDGDPYYLRNRLQTVQQRKGKGKFHAFYSYFLLALFHEGFAKQPKDRKLDADLMGLLGEVPYLNGGLFEVHQLEELYPQIDIPDEAFENLFAFFDQWDWTLDIRPLRSGKEINPDVLGYIFEKYINQKEMGAYYTKEDITEYISKNTILPHLFDAAEKKCAVAFQPNSALWRLLRDDPDRYIYPAVRQGVIDEQGKVIPESTLPEFVQKGMHDPKARMFNKAYNLGQAHIPDGSGNNLALPTETWRAYVDRRQRCLELREKLRDGGIQQINALITYNLNIRQLAEDAITQCEGPELLRAFYQAIANVTVLDPTCGSGAFLFAALNILEPLYEACLNRMQAFVEDLERSGERHSPKKFEDFRKVLADIDRHPNRAYFILKSIIINNLYGVDIMEEAVEICKLRLFLKLVAQVDSVKHLEPLPDVDFNIRAGNTLVGFASLAEVKKTQEGTLGFGKDKVARIEEAAADVNRLVAMFRRQQKELGGTVTAADKKNLRQKLSRLTDELNLFLANEYGVDAKKKDAFDKWRKGHQPFHWFAEFYGIMNDGGFDVIIGNPPYAEIPKDLSRSLLRSTFKSALERWSRDEDLYTLVVERSLWLLRVKTGQFGMILPLSVTFSTKRPFVALRQVLGEEKGLWLWSHFDRIPSSLFGNEVRTRCTIALLTRNPQAQLLDAATTALLRWNVEFRECLFKTLNYTTLDLDISVGIPKVSSQVQAEVLKRLLTANAPLALDLTQSIPFNELAKAAPNFPQPCTYVGGTAYNWFPAWWDIPETTDMDGKSSLPARTAGFRFTSEESANVVFALLCSSMGYWWWAVASDGFNLKKWLLERFPVSILMIPSKAREQLAQLGEALRRELKQKYVYKDNKGRIGNFFLPACEKETVAIDTFLASSVPGLSLDFFEDIRDFNTSFSRVELSDDEEGDE